MGFSQVVAAAASVGAVPPCSCPLACPLTPLKGEKERGVELVWRSGCLSCVLAAVLLGLGWRAAISGALLFRGRGGVAPLQKTGVVPLLLPPMPICLLPKREVVGLFSLETVPAADLTMVGSASLSSTVSQPPFLSAGGLPLGHPFRGVQAVKVGGVLPLDTSLRGLSLRPGSGIASGVGFGVGFRVSLGEVCLLMVFLVSFEVSKTADVRFFRVGATACRHSYASYLG